VEVVAHQTKPPARFTEATLLSAMEGAGKLVEDEELREAMRDKGLGTPATRAAIIEGLLYEKYLFRQGRDLIPTAKAFSLITLLRGLAIPELAAPELTGGWEFKLRQMEHGQLSRHEFMHEIADMTRHIVDQAKRHESDTVPGDFATLKVPCPKCGGVIKENYKKFQCQSCDFSLWKIASGRQFEVSEIEELISKRVVGPLQGFRSKMGKPFAGLIRLTPELKPEFDFGQGTGEGAGVEVDFSGQEPLGKCPKCGASVFENGPSYVCEKAVGGNRTCDFRSGGVILQQPIDREQMKKLLATGKTDLMPKFISKKGRPFGAFLVVGEGGKVGFEFAPRESKGRGKKSAAGSKAGEAAKVEKIDFTGQETLGKCPKCGGRVFEAEKEYVCENSQASARPCKFRAGKLILQQSVDREQVGKLLATGRTDLLEKFISKTGRPFPAFLVLDDNGKVSFEFPPRDEAVNS
jgi:DNA topoisomerase-3